LLGEGERRVGKESDPVHARKIKKKTQKKKKTTPERQRRVVIIPVGETTKYCNPKLRQTPLLLGKINETNESGGRKKGRGLSATLNTLTSRLEIAIGSD